MYLCGRGVSFVPEESGPIRLAYSSGYDCTTTMHLLNIFAPLLLLLLLLPACSDDAAETPEESTELNEVSSTTLTNLHPVLDSRVRTGDSMLVDLDGLIREGVIAEGDMELIGFYVRSLGGLNDPDGSLARKSYRQLIREALVSDLSDPQEEPCAGCRDSLIIYFPDNNGMVYFGGMISRRFPPTCIPVSPSSQPAITCPVPTVNSIGSNGYPPRSKLFAWPTASIEVSNRVPSARYPA